MDREYLKGIFENADKYINENPKVINWSVDTIFKELSDGTKDMISIRWGIMAKAIIHSIDSFEITPLINDLKQLYYNEFLCEFVGYLLQVEKGIDLVELLVEAEKENCADIILAYVINHISNENIYEFAYHEPMLKIASSTLKEGDQYKFMREYSKLIVEKGDIGDVVNHYIEKPTKIYEILISHVAFWLFPKKEDKARDAVQKLNKYENQHFVNSIIDIIRQSVNYDNHLFDDYFDIISGIFGSKYLDSQRLISIFVAYLENVDQGIFRNEVSKWLMGVSKSGAVEKNVLLNEFGYRKVKSTECKRIIRAILVSNFDKEESVLNNADLYLSEIVQENCTDGIALLKQIFMVNCFNVFDAFFAKMPYTSSALSEHRITVLKDAIENILNGDEKELYFGIREFIDFYSRTSIGSIVNDKQLNDKDLIRIIEGVLIFAIEPRKLCELVFEMYPYVVDKEQYYSKCKDIVYGNYPKTFVKEAEVYKKDSEPCKYEMANRLLNEHELQMAEVKEVYAIKDLWPSEKRRLSYRMAEYEQRRKISDKATSESVLMSLINIEKMKFGKRHAIIQTRANNEHDYQVMDYVVNEYEFELPMQFINNPVKQYLMQVVYLEGRKGDEISN